MTNAPLGRLTWKLDAAKSKGADATTPQSEIIAAAVNGYTVHEVTQIRAGSQQTADMDVVPNAIDGSITVNGQAWRLRRITMMICVTALSWPAEQDRSGTVAREC